MTGNNDFFTFKEFDPEGFATLKIISDAKNFNNWTYQTIAPSCGGRILEIGSGIGNISEHFVNAGTDLWLSDIRANYRVYLEQKFPQLGKQNKILNLDLVHPEFETTYSSLKESFETVFALNVVEHIKDDAQAIRNASYLLKPGGTLIILVPAYQSLYNSFDKELMHFKRYSASTLESLFINSKLKIHKTFHFNAGGIPGWFVSGKIQKHKTIPSGQMKTFDLLVPAFKIIDKLLFNKIGLSVICVGKKLG